MPHGTAHDGHSRTARYPQPTRCLSVTIVHDSYVFAHLRPRGLQDVSVGLFLVTSELAVSLRVRTHCATPRHAPLSHVCNVARATTYDVDGRKSQHDRQPTRKPRYPSMEGGEASLRHVAMSARWRTWRLNCQLCPSGEAAECTDLTEARAHLVCACKDLGTHAVGIHDTILLGQARVTH